MVPLVLAVLVGALQVMVLAYTAHAASQAARDGARAFSLGQSPAAAAQASLPGSDQPGDRAPPTARTTAYGSRCEAPPMLFLVDRRRSPAR